MHAAEPELAAQELGRDPPRQRRRPIGIERRVEDVRGHERLHPGRAPPPRTAPARRRAGARESCVDHRQLEVRVGARVAVTGEVLAAADHARRRAGRARTPARARATASGVVAERAVADHRVGGVRVHVEHRREVPADAERRQLLAERPPDRCVRAASPAAPTASIGGQSVAGARSRCTSPPPDRSTPAAARPPARPPAAPPTSAATWPGLAMLGRNSITPPTSDAAMRARSSSGTAVPSNPTESSWPQGARARSTPPPGRQPATRPGGPRPRP